MIGQTSLITRRVVFSSASFVRPCPSLAPFNRVALYSSATNNPYLQRKNDGYFKILNLNRSFVNISSHRGFQLREKVNIIQAATFSTAKGDKEDSGGIRGWINDRQTRQEKEKYVEQMTRLSTMEVFTMEKYREELQMGIDGGGMMTKISFMQTKEFKQAKEVIEVVDKIIEVVGPDATAEDLLHLDRLQRLRVATAANKTLEEISIMVSQITNMDVMQKTLRKRYLEGKPIPPDKESMQLVIQKDAMSVLSKSQKEMMKSRQESNARRKARRRR